MKRVLDQLSSDFLNFDDRAKKIADDARIKYTSWQVLVPLIIVVLSLAAAFSTSVVDVWGTQSDLRSDLEVLEGRLDVAGVQQQVSDLESQLELEERLDDLDERLSKLAEEHE